MGVSELFLVRHGESIGNVAATKAELDGLDAIPLDIRDADVPLSDTGREQAVALGRWLDSHHAAIDTYWVSPYLRAQETLSIALGDRPVQAGPIVDERLRDRELGILDLLTRRGAAARHPEEMARRLHLGKFYHRPPGGESWADVALRLRSFLRDHRDGDHGDGDHGDHGDGHGGTAMLVAHDAVVMLLLYILVPMREQELLDFAADHTVLNASVTHLVRRHDRWELESFSDVAHLQQAGADVTVHPGSPDVEPT